MAQPISEAARILGARIKERRKKLGNSQEEIALLADMNVSNYGKIERGLGNPNFHTVIVIAAVLTIDPADLVRGIGKNDLPKRERVFTAAEFIAEKRRRAN
ncbi:helix-turn-helix domain-containing protein [Lacisediminihabitans changchengi]|uniref:Helix-turn-helix transcriptional regulator n=1 Tax=Lacisediminihabitans changchengi TaxID=2787634 RepID=A0A934SSL9_9MICO|nr:helix-turn-helix transcriptional regulator [Lacisediminihabitans changchengi]MBK4347384.1 helix-turn-helix transcriptional regulator [Lacisediminihabitans changchengi]